MTDVTEFLARHHNHLAAWLSDCDERRLDAFLAAHHEDFSLVATSGAIFDLVALRESLRDAGGSQPGLTIEVHATARITEQVHRFSERHTVDGSVLGIRIVTAVVRDSLLLAVHETTLR
ncbi:hypothetical protein ACXIZN_25245 [Amycolatopsis sp. TRM77291]